MSFKPITAYFHYQTFLQDFAQQKRAMNSSWSLGAWAKKLKLGGAASISRIVSGDRIPGDELTTALIDYFEFNETEEAYFKKLVERERYYAGNSFAGDPILILKNAQLLVLQGILNTEKVRTYLRPFNLEPLLVGDHVLGAINVNHYPNSTLGTFRETYLCFTVRPINGGMLDSGLFFTGFSCNSEKVIAAYDSFGGHHPTHSPIEIERNSNDVEASIGNRGIHMKLPVNPEDMTRIEEKYEMNMFALTFQKNLFKSRFIIDSLGLERNFDPTRDTFNVENNIPVASEINKLGFTPAKWILHENLFSVNYRPTSVIPRGSY